MKNRLKILLSICGLLGSTMYGAWDETTDVNPHNSKLSISNNNPGVIRVNNVQPTEKYNPTNVNAWLKIDIDKETDAVHFVRDNNNPFVVTKTYALENADPYQIRKFINTAIQANMVDRNPTVVDCIKFNDGKGLLIVGAEDYRFTSNKNGMSIDEIVSTLDKPDITAYQGQRTFMYFPRYWDSRSLAAIVKRVGANITEANTNELRYGSDKIGYDEQLNCLFMYVPQYSRKNIQDMLKLYDSPTWEVKVKYKLYELDAENDGKIGADFEAWKNNAGVDFFGVGGQFRSGWSATWDGGAMPKNNGYGNTRYSNFNPKWNSRYLDFLAVQGHAKVVTSGSLAVLNQMTGTVIENTNLFNPEFVKIPDQTLDSYIICDPYDATTADGNYRVTSATDSSGTSITVSGTGVISVSKITYGSFTSYYLNVMSGSAFFEKGGANIGTSTKAYNVVVQKCIQSGNDLGGGASYTLAWTDQTNWNTDLNLKIYHGYQEWTTTNPEGYGFTMNLTPAICENATIMNLSMVNSSLIGWNSDGSPRIDKDSEINTKVMISNKDNTFVIGGLEKKTVVSSVSGMPYLKDLPGIGWLFSTESESTKKSQLVLVMECSLNNPDTKIGQGELGDVIKINEGLKNAGEKNSWGKDQYYIGIDPNKS